MVLYGDSHAAMWFRAFDDIATRAHWKLVILSKGACPAAPLPTHPPGGTGDWVACDQWHRFAVDRINQLDPTLLIITQNETPTPDSRSYSPAQWQSGLEELLNEVTAPKTVKVVLGNIPPIGGPGCLVRHIDDVQACARPPHPYLRFVYEQAEKLATEAVGARYIDVTPWFCAKRCSSVIGDYDVYFNSTHVAVGYTRFLEGVLGDALDLQRAGSAESRR